MQRVKRSTAVAAMPAPPGGGTPGYFASPIPQGGVPATIPGYEWFNSVQEELCAVIAAAGITLDITNSAQLLAALRSAGVFQTPPQFDQSTKVATMAALARMGMQASGFNIASASSTLTAAAVGGTVQIVNSTGPVTLTLPLTSAVLPAIGRIEFVNQSAYPATIIRQGASDNLYHLNGALAASGIVLMPGDVLILECESTNIWVAVSGTTELGYSAAFGASLAAAGYQKQPSGLIVQWGTTNTAVAANTPTGMTWTFPIAFPNACLFATASPGNFVTSSRTSESWNTTSATGFAQHSSAQTLKTLWFAIGY